MFSCIRISFQESETLVSFDDFFFRLFSLKFEDQVQRICKSGQFWFKWTRVNSKKFIRTWVEVNSGLYKLKMSNEIHENYWAAVS